MHSESDNIKFMISYEADEVIKNFLIHLKIDIKLIYNRWSSKFALDYVQLLYCKCHKINVSRGGSYIGSPDWIKKATINPISKKDKCFQYAVTVALNYEEIGKHAGRITKTKPFINKFN